MGDTETTQFVIQDMANRLLALELDQQVLRDRLRSQVAEIDDLKAEIYGVEGAEGLLGYLADLGADVATGKQAWQELSALLAEHQLHGHTQANLSEG
jgi:hypothetical protein